MRYAWDNILNTTQKTDLVVGWMEQAWIPDHPKGQWRIMTPAGIVMERRILEKFNEEDIELAQGYRFKGRIEAKSSAVNSIYSYNRDAEVFLSEGTFIYQFERGEDLLEVVIVTTDINDSNHCGHVTLSCIQESTVPVWMSFVDQCHLFAYPPGYIRVVGGESRTLKPNVRLDDIILSQSLKDDILGDVETFYEQGVEIYKSLGLNPFRKILLAGVPGTGKTMMCNALANWAIDQNYIAIYISSSSRGPNERDGSNFWKIQEALNIGRYSGKPALVILEELDAYLKPEEKALILNVLDGSESTENQNGTLLVATTNYPEAIDPRLMKRPGRLDRVYIVPPIEDDVQAKAMLKHYLKHLWREEHDAFAPQLVGHPGAFVREVVVFAISQLLGKSKMELPLEELQASYDKLQSQIEERDALITANAHAGVSSNGAKKTVET